jgi:hypothetical protein
MGCRSAFAGVLLAGGLAACGAIDASVDPRYDTVNRSLAKLRNEAILLNIVRASHNYPLNFATIGKVSPGMINTTSAGLPSFLLGPSPRNLEPTFSPGRDAIFGNSVLSDSIQINSNYDISTQETKDFYNGLLSPVGLGELLYFIRQGYPRELLFWLFADSFEIGQLGFQYNPPYGYGCPPQERKHRCFREFVELAVITGLTAEQKTIRREASGKIETLEYYRFCFSRALGDRDRLAMQELHPERLRIILERYVDRGALRSPLCGSHWDPETVPVGEREKEGGKASSNRIPGETDTLQAQLGPYRFRIVTRSAFSIYQFLGKLLRQEQGALPPLAPDVPEDELVPSLSSVYDDSSVLTVANGSPNCFVHTYFIDGDYCVPEEAANTKRIFSILAQLIALKTNAGDLAITPTVRTLPSQ